MSYLILDAAGDETSSEEKTRKYEETPRDMRSSARHGSAMLWPTPWSRLRSQWIKHHRCLTENSEVLSEEGSGRGMGDKASGALNGRWCDTRKVKAEKNTSIYEQLGKVRYYRVYFVYDISYILHDNPRGNKYLLTKPVFLTIVCYNSQMQETENLNTQNFF